MKKIPVLIIIPHGGYKVPEELEKFVIAGDFEIFISADTCANEIFSFEKFAAAVINTSISKLLIDLNRQPFDIPPKTDDGVIKKLTPFGKTIFEENIFPDKIAITNILKRYYYPFHEAVGKISNSDDIRLIIECHTIPAIENYNSGEKSNPLFRISYKADINSRTVETCPKVFAEILMQNLQKNFSDEKSGSRNKFEINDRPLLTSIITKNFSRIPYLRLDISKQLFLNDEYFNYDYMKVDQLRLSSIKKKIWISIDKMYNKCF